MGLEFIYKINYCLVFSGRQLAQKVDGIEKLVSIICRLSFKNLDACNL